MEIVNPAFDYDHHNPDYANHRRADTRIATQIHQLLGGARTVLNVGAGAGSYEPTDRYVVAVEPSVSMRRQRMLAGRCPAVNASADSLPFDDGAFEASMALLTVHHWSDLEKGLRELRRVTIGAVVIMSFDPQALDLFWNIHYFPELVEVERQRYPSMQKLLSILGNNTRISDVVVPLDCTDGFQEAFFGRPEAFLNPEVRRAQSAWGFLPHGLEDTYVRKLEEALASGEWDRRFGAHRRMPEFKGALRLIVSSSGADSSPALTP